VKIDNRTFFGDNADQDSPYFQDAENSRNSLVLAPVNTIKGQNADLKQNDKATDYQFSTAVSKIRQAIESLFNWLIEKTGI
jgi:hypothetical protein